MLLCYHDLFINYTTQIIRKKELSKEFEENKKSSENGTINKTTFDEVHVCLCKGRG